MTSERALDVAVVRDVAGNLGGVAPLEDQAHPVRCAMPVLQAQQLPGESLLLAHAGADLALTPRDRAELVFQRPAPLRQFEERAMRFGERLAAGAQLVGRFAPRFLRARQLRLQLLDALAQVAQLLPARRRIGRRLEERGPREDREEEASKQHARDARRGHRRYFALPWLATECMALATASASPR